MKLSIKAELVYTFAPATQIIANIEASQSNDQTVLSDSLEIQPPIQLVSDKTPYGDRSIRASFSGEVTILYRAVVENNLRQLLPSSGHQHLWSDLPNDVLPFLLPSRFCPSDKFMRFAQREFGGAGDGVARVMAILDWIHRNVDYVPGVSNAETTAERTFVAVRVCVVTSPIWALPFLGRWVFPPGPSAPMRFNWSHPTSTRSSRCFSKIAGG
jgi:transglutaminase-like putative cysteine protease